MPVVVWWLKKDFRLADNPALDAALADARAAGTTVLPVFLFEPRVLAAEETSAFHVAAWCEALADLRARLAPHGAGVLALHADAADAFARLHDAVGIAAVHSHEEVGTEVTFARDRAIKTWFAGAGVPWHERRQTAVFRGLRDRDTRTKRWNAFTFATPPPTPGPADLALVRVPEAAAALGNLPAPAPEDVGHPLTPAQAAHRQPVSESAAEATLHSFLHERGQCYSGGISSPNLAFTCGSRLSVHLAWGTLTGRAAYTATRARLDALAGDPSEGARAWRRSLASFKSRLHWRDHFIQRLETEPGMEFEPLNAAYASLPTPGDEHLDAWLAGRTGWPLVDACMRCATATGFLNFRMRAFITSVSVHSLRIDWRKTLYPTARLWADYEPGIHIAQTQMQAGVVGINQLRVYSPDKQLADQDPDAAFVRQWVPELADAPPEAILRHGQPAMLFETPLPGYPAPLVDWRASSAAMRDDYYAIRRRPETRALAETVFERHGSRRPAEARTWKNNAPKASSPRGTRRATLPPTALPPADA